MRPFFFALPLFIAVQIAAPCAEAMNSVGHYDDTTWAGLDDAAGYDDVTVDITVEASPDRAKGAKDAYYYSNYVHFTGGTTAYGGLQTNGHDGKKWVGKMLIFSVWNATNGIAEPGGTKTAFSGEGTGYSVRLPFDWSVGTTYRFAMYLDGTAPDGERIWAAKVTDLGSGRETRIGRIFVPRAEGKIRKPITFHERDRGPTESCSDVSRSRVRFTNMTAQGGTVRASGFRHRVSVKLPECPSIERYVDEKTGYANDVA
jgi:hypothetical protein